MAIITSLSSDGYRVTADSGIVIDPETTMVTRRRDVVFRGELNRLFDVFRFGEQSEIPDGSQARLYCAGPQSVRLIEGTASDPHWQATIEHVGLHSYVHGGSRTSVFRLTPLWTKREIELPRQYHGDDGAGNEQTYTFYAGTSGGYLPSGVPVDHPCTIHDSLPGYQARGIIYTNLAVTPSNPAFTTLLATLGTPSTADTVNYAANAFAGYNWCKGMPTSTSAASNTVGKWFIADITAERMFEPLDGTVAYKIYQVTFTIQWLQRKAPL